MVESSKKQPAIPLMIGDYFKDPLLGQASLLSRGAWFELLLYMWECDRRGEIETTIYGLNRLLGAGSIDEILFFLNELNDLEFGDLFATDEKSALVFPLTLENCNGKVTIRNRRMYADYKDRQNTRLRVRKYRETKKKRPMKQKCNADVTPSLSISSSIAVSKNNQQADFFRNTIHPYFTSIERNALFISKFKDKKSFNPFGWVNKQINKLNAHPGAVDYTLQQMSIYWETILNPNGYAVDIMKKENGNFNEREHIEDHEQVKKDYADFIENSEELKNIIRGIGNEPRQTN